MAAGPGVSATELNDDSGRWRVRWRESVNDGVVTRRVQREKVVRDEATAIALRAKILRAVETGEVFESEVRVELRVATLDDVFAGWLRARSAKGIAPNTLKSYGDRVKRLLRAFHGMLGVPETKAVPGTALTRSGVADVTNYLRRRGSRPGDSADDALSEGTIHGTIQTLVAAWVWASDDPKAYPGLEPAPRDTSALTVRAPVYGETESPTMAECDEVIKIIAGLGVKARRVALPVSVIARCTGLRCSQILSIRACDVDLERLTLVVATGKGRRETAQRRTVPLAPVLIGFLQPYVAAAVAVSFEAPLLPRRADAKKQAAAGPSKTLRNAWDAAAGRRLVRPAVWAPSSASKRAYERRSPRTPFATRMPPRSCGLEFQSRSSASR